MQARKLTEGSIPGHLLHLAVPVIVGMLLQSVYALVDLGWVARIGESAVAGLSISLQAFFLVLAVSQMLATTALADISQAWGGGQYKEAGGLLSSYLCVGVFLGLLTALVAYLGAEAYVFALSEDAGVRVEGVAYFQVNTITFFTQLLMLVVGVSFRGSGDFGTPVRVLASSVVLNLILDPVLIFGVRGWDGASWLSSLQSALLTALGLGDFTGMGIAGAAWATVISQVSVLLIYAVLLLKKGRTGIRLGRPKFSSGFFGGLVKRGIPAGIQFFLLSAVLGILLYAMKPHGKLWTATAGGGFRILQQALLPIIALASAAAATAGQNAGAHLFDRVRETCRVALRMVLLYAVGATLLMLVGGRVLGLLFADEGGLDAAALYFQWSALTLIGFAAGMVPTFVLQALKRPILPMLASAARIGLLAALIFGVVTPLSLGPEWAFGAATLSALLEGALSAWVLWWVLRAMPKDPPIAE